MLMFRRCRGHDMVLLNGCISRIRKRGLRCESKMHWETRGDCMICMNITLEQEYPREGYLSYPSFRSPSTQHSSP
jgi:hypothetical protein